MAVHDLKSDRPLPPPDWAALDARRAPAQSTSLLLRVCLVLAFVLLTWVFVFQSIGGWAWLVSSVVFSVLMGGVLWEAHRTLARFLLGLAGLIVLGAIFAGFVMLCMLFTVVRW